MLVFLTVPCFPLSVNLKKLLRSGCCWFFGGRAVLDSCLSIYKSRGSCLLYYIYIFLQAFKILRGQNNMGFGPFVRS